MKSVLISIRPKWCELIANGKKTIEVRKTKPKIEMPFKVYIYCTKDKSKEIRYEKPDGAISDNGKHYSLFSTGKVIGEFVCDDIDTISVHNETLYCENNSQANKLQQMCLSVEEIKKYLGQKNLGYNWHISDLKIYDKPKELREFYVNCDWVCGDCDYFINDECASELKGHKPLKRPPQSYCYCEEEFI